MQTDLLPPSAAQEARSARARGIPASPSSASSVAPRLRFQPFAETDLTADERVHIAVYETANRSVVNITTLSARSRGLFMIEVPSEGAGSGSVLDKEGHIVTNRHVLEGAREIEVTLFDGKSYEATVVGDDASSDLAVIRVAAPPESLAPVVFGDSTRLRVGQRVYAIGNPFGLDRTMTTGIVSSLNRSLPSRNQRTIKSIIQIDAAVNPGNSGGPLLDSHSRVIGMNTAIASATGQNTGVGFAIPAATILRIVPQLISQGRVIRPGIGIAQVERTDHGLRILELIPDGPAEQAGLQGPRLNRERRRQGPFVYESTTIDRTAADLIVGIDGQPVTTADELLTWIESKRPGDEVVLAIIRGGQEVAVRVKLGEEGE
jgi:S1-C subfamily serine protease